MMYNNGFHGFPSISDQQPLMLEKQPGWDETKGPPCKMGSGMEEAGRNNKKHIKACI